MLSGSREDDLLNKLKNCVGSLPAHSQSSSQGNYSCSTGMKPKPFEREGSSAKRETSELGRCKQPSYNHLDKELKSNRITPSLYTYRHSFETMDRKNLPKRGSEAMPSNDCSSIQRQDLRYSANQNKEEPFQRYPLCKKNDENHQIHKGAAEIKQTLCDRYSGKVTNRSVAKAVLQPSVFTNSNPVGLGRSQKAEDIEAIARKYKPPTARSQDLHTGIGTPTTYNFRGRSSIKAPFAPQQLERPSTHRSGKFEQTTRVEPQQKEVVGRDECSAMAKLRKISQLNEKINERIRNIIAVFEDQKL